MNDYRRLSALYAYGAIQNPAYRPSGICFSQATRHLLKQMASRSFFYKVYVGASIRASHGCARQTLNCRHPLDADERLFFSLAHLLRAASVYPTSNRVSGWRPVPSGCVSVRSTDWRIARLGERRIAGKAKNRPCMGKNTIFPPSIGKNYNNLYFYCPERKFV